MCRSGLFTALSLALIFSLSSCRGCSQEKTVAVCYFEKIMCDEVDAKPFWNSSFHECKPMNEKQCQALATSEEDLKNFCNESNFKIGDTVIKNPVFYPKGLCEPDKNSKREKGACFFNERSCSVENNIYSTTDKYHLCLELTAEECQDLQETCNETCSINSVDKDSFCTDDRTANGDLFKYDFKFVDAMSCPKNLEK